MRKIFVLAVVLTFFLAAAVIQAAEYQISNTGVWPGFINPRAIASDDIRNLVFCGTGDVIGIYDSDMTFKGNFRVSTKTGIKGLAYDNDLKILHVAAGTSGYIAVDASDIQNLKLVSTISENPSNPGLVMGGEVKAIDAYAVKYTSGTGTQSGRKFVFLADYNFGMRVYDVTEPDSIFETGFYRQDSQYESKTTGSYINIDSLVHEGKLYVFALDRYYGLRVFDATDPKKILKPVSKDLRDFYYNSISLVRDLSPAVYDNKLYCFVTGPNTSSTQAAVVKYQMIIDQNPSDSLSTAIKEIKNIGRCDTLAMGRGMDLGGNYAFIADHNKGVRIVDILNPVSTTQTGIENYAIKADISDGVAGAYSVFVNGNSLFLSDYRKGLRFYDVSNPEHPVDPGHSPVSLINGRAVDVVEINVDNKNKTYAFMASEGSSPALYVFDVTTQDSVKLESARQLSSSPSAVRISGDFAYIAAGDDGLYIVNVFDPKNPGNALRVDTPGFAHDLAVKDGYVYIADGSSGLAVVDAKNPLSPSAAKSYPAPGKELRAIEVKGNYAYFASGEKGLSVCDISDPLNPVIDKAAMDTPGVSQGLFVSGNYAYIADGSSGLQVLDISDPLHPGQPLQTTISGVARDVSVSGDYAFLTRGESGYAVVNLKDIKYSSVVANYATLGSASGIKIYKDGVFVADGPGVLNISKFAEKNVEPLPSLKADDPENVCFIRTVSRDSSSLIRDLLLMVKTKFSLN